MRRLKKNIVLVFCLFALVFFHLASVQAAEDARKQLALHYFRGVVNFEAGRYEEALTEFQAVHRIDPYYKNTPKYIDNCVRRLEKVRGDMLESAGLRDSEKAEIDIYFLGKSYYEKGDYRKARAAFKAVLDKNPQDRFALYYLDLCEKALPPGSKKSKRIRTLEKGEQAMDLEKEVSYIKDDLKEQQDMEGFLADKVERKVERDSLIRQKERQLKQQEQVLEEEKQDYLAQAKVVKRTQRIKEETEKWKRMKEKLAFKQPGIPATLTEYPYYMDKALRYYDEMQECLRTSRWNSAGLNAIQASLNYCDSILIYFYGVKSAYPEHENMTRLLAENVKRSDVDENIFRLRNILNLKQLVEKDDRSFTRTEALFLSENAERLIEWCRSVLP